MGSALIQNIFCQSPRGVCFRTQFTQFAILVVDFVRLSARLVILSPEGRWKIPPRFRFLPQRRTRAHADWATSCRSPPRLAGCVQQVCALTCSFSYWVQAMPLRYRENLRTACLGQQGKQTIMRDRFSKTKCVLGCLAAVVTCLGAQADPQDGALLFKRECAVCHSVVPGQTIMGPSLAGVIGRPAGSVEAFRYSPAMRSAGFTWTEDEISSFIESPRKRIPGTNMAFPGERHPEKRAAIVGYLKTLSSPDDSTAQ